MHKLYVFAQAGLSTIPKVMSVDVRNIQKDAKRIKCNICNRKGVSPTCNIV